MNNTCVWCSVGIEAREKFCSQCGGPNVHFMDTKFFQSPITNIGTYVRDYTIALFNGEYCFQIPRYGTLRRIIVTTQYPLTQAQIIENGNLLIVNQKPKTNEFIYTGELRLEKIANLELRIKTKFQQGALITLETD